MVEQVKDRKFYHVTVSKPYKQAFSADQTMVIGNGYNPFFQFYESIRQYPVNHNGHLVNVPAKAWLRQVRDGIINTSPQTLVTIGLEIATHYVMLVRELIMEELRREEFDGTPPSRQRCLYVCESLTEALYWRDRLGDNGTVCELTCTGTVHRADAALLLGDSEPLSVTKERGRAYWRGDVTQHPELETLIVGQAKVTGFEL